MATPRNDTALLLSHIGNLFDISGHDTCFVPLAVLRCMVFTVEELQVACADLGWTIIVCPIGLTFRRVQSVDWDTELQELLHGDSHSG